MWAYYFLYVLMDLVKRKDVEVVLKSMSRDN